jgi:hypothetical protein
MLREETFQKAAYTFGTAVGVAHLISYKGMDIETSKPDIVELDESSDDMIINNIILKSIGEGKYQKLYRRLYYYKGRGYKKIKEVTIYKKAYKDINGNS